MAFALPFRFLQPPIILFVAIVLLNCSASNIPKHPISVGGSAKSNLTINVYYETLCPSSRDFIAKKVCPLWEKYKGQYFLIDLIPYGNAWTYGDRQSGHYQIECQNGHQECIENTIHACALKHLSYPEAIKLICCCSKSYRGGKCPACAKRLGIDYKPVETCAHHGSEGLELHYDMGMRTANLNPKQEYVPWILINGVYNQNVMNQASENLESVVCIYLDVIGGPRPKSCAEYYVGTNIVGKSKI